MKVLAVTNMYPTPHHPTSGTFVEQQVEGLRCLGLEIDVLLVDRYGDSIGSRYFGLPRMLQRKLHQYDADLVHVMYGGLMADLVTRIVRDRPVIISFCGSDLLGGDFLGAMRRIVVRWGVMASHRAARRASAIIVKSQNLRDALPADIDRGNVWIIPNGVNLARFRPLDKAASRSKLGWEDNCFHVIFPSNQRHPRKRFELAMAAITRLNDEGIRTQLHPLSGVSHEDVPIWLNASDALILTSIHEGSPNMVKEALACNRPVVSTDVGDVRDWIKDIDGCYLAQAEPDDLARGLRSIFKGCGSVAGRTKIEEQLSLGRVAARLIDVYSHLLGRNGLQTV
jgi:glycosyltransferase involved in cell wall biosynthesis